MGAERLAGVLLALSSLEIFWALGARRTAGVIFFLRSTPWKFFGVHLTWISILEYDDCKKISKWSPGNFFFFCLNLLIIYF